MVKEVGQRCDEENGDEIALFEAKSAIGKKIGEREGE